MGVRPAERRVPALRWWRWGLSRRLSLRRGLNHLLEYLTLDVLPGLGQRSELLHLLWSNNAGGWLLVRDPLHQRQADGFSEFRHALDRERQPLNGYDSRVANGRVHVGKVLHDGDSSECAGADRGILPMDDLA